MGTLFRAHAHHEGISAEIYVRELLQSPGINCLAELPDFLDAGRGDVQVVSFDVFDTLVWRVWTHRRVVEAAVVGLHEALQSRVSGLPSVEILLDDRLAFEARAEAETHRTGREWAVSQWWDQVAGEWGLDLEMVSRLGAKTQLDAETSGTFRPSGVASVLARLRERGVQPVATSDTYLSDDLLGELLATYDLRFEECFASSSLGVSKRRGGLFETIAALLEVSPGAILHVGDNFKSDAVRPAGTGCRFLWLPRTVERPPEPAWLVGDPPSDWSEVARALDAPTDSRSRTPEYRFGRDQLAPLFCAFAVWVWRRLGAQNATDALFVAREGRLLQGVLDELSDELPGLPSLHYARLSRRSVTLALRENWLRDCRGVPGKLGEARFEDFLGQFDLPASFERQLLSYAGLDASDAIDARSEQAWREAVDAHIDRLEQIRGESRGRLRTYLEEIVGAGELHSWAFVDSASAGTIQQAVSSVLDDGEAVTGLYLGVSDQGAEPDDASQKFGILRDDYREGLEVPCLKAAGVIRVLELICANPEEPTTMGLRAGASRIEPNFGVSRRLPSRHRRSLDDIEKGLFAGVRDRSRGVHYLARRGRELTLDSIETYARLCARAAFCFPPRDVATSLLDIEFDEGARGGHRSSLGLAGLADGTMWMPGILAKYFMGWLQCPLDAMTTIYDHQLDDSSASERVHE